MVMLQEIDKGLCADIEEDDSVEILELGTIRKPSDVNGDKGFVYLFDGMWFMQDMTE